MAKKYKVSIIIVYYSKYKELVRCLKSLEKYPLKKSFEVIVVNNSPKHISLPKTKLSVKNIKSPSNLGYGGGNNLGVKHADGEYVLILNPDTELIDQSLNILIKFLDTHPRVAIVGPNLVHPNGVVFSQLGSRTLTPLRGIFALSILNKILPNNPISKGYWLYDTALDELREVDVVPGSGLLIKKKYFEAVGGFDEKFFLYFEESDLCKRLKEKYPKVKFFIHPESQLIHYWRPKEPGTMESQRIFAKSRFYYFHKHYGLVSALLVEFFARLNKYHLGLIFVVLLMLLVMYLW